jgi:membrane-associated phospholipid phosphatase
MSTATRTTDPTRAPDAAGADRRPVAHTPSGARRWLLAIALGVGAVALAHALDHAAWQGLRDPRVYERDWGRMLRSMGYLPTWLIVAIGLWTHDRPQPGWGWRGGLAILAPLSGGALAELLKLVVRRVRPDAALFGYSFRSFADHPFANNGLGMPSSHVLVAFAGATAMARLFPRAWWLWYLLAIGCAVTRVMAVAHFLSDTVAAAVLGWFVGEALSRWMLQRQSVAITR